MNSITSTTILKQCTNWKNTSEITVLTGISFPTITKYVKHLIKEKFLEKMITSDHRENYHVRITSKGKEFVNVME